MQRDQERVRAAAPHRDGLPAAGRAAALDLRQRRLRAAAWPGSTTGTASTNWSSAACRQAVLWDEVKDRLNSLGTKLSGGQQQRLTLARALSLEPEILCLDEFSIAIDPVTTMKIEDVLVQLKGQMTIILVTNLIQQAQRIADDLMFLNDSEIVEVGPTEQAL